MNNLVYKLIKDIDENNLSTLSGNYTVINKEAYYLLVPSKQQPGFFFIENDFYNVIDYHISIYQDLKENDQNAEFHLTVTLKKENDKTDQKLIARAFYTRNGNFLFLNVKNELGSVLKIDEYGIKNFCFTSMLPFVEIIGTIHKNKTKEFETIYNEYVTSLCDINKELDGKSGSSAHELKTSYAEYQNKLEQVVEQIKIAVYFEIFNSKTYLRYFEKHLEGFKKRRKELDYDIQLSSNPSLTETHTQIIQNLSVKTKNKPIDKISEIRNSIRKAQQLRKTKPYEAIKKEYDNQQKLLKSNLDNNEFLDTITRVFALEEETKKILITLLITEEIYNKTKDEDLDNLISVAKFNSGIHLIFVYALQNNRINALEKILDAVKNGIDLNKKITIKLKETYPLLFAYQNKILTLFQWLLTKGAIPELRMPNGTPLLVQTCVDQRSEEMKSLLQARANPFVVHESGFAALGILVMRGKGEPNIETTELFLELTKDYAPEVVNQLQGVLGHEAIPLTYACQKGWKDCTELLLKYNADPNKIRRDGYSSLAVCIYKENTDLLKTIFDKTNIEIKYGLCSALLVAEDTNQTDLLEFMNDYIKKRGYKDVRPCIRFPAGVPRSFIDRFLNHTDKQVDKTNDSTGIAQIKNNSRGSGIAFFPSLNNCLAEETDENKSPSCKNKKL